MDRIKEIAQKYGVSIQVRYSDAEDSWYGEIISAAESERLEIKRIHDYDTLVDYLEEHLKGEYYE